MNNQAISTAARIAPPLALVLLAGIVIKALFFGEKPEQKPETKPASVTPPNPIPPMVPMILPPMPVPVAPKPPEPIAVSTAPLSDDFPKERQSQKRNIVLREDMAAIFNNGSRSLYRVEAVAELQRHGFSQTAAYKALLADGRFASWLMIAPDGIISWKTC